MMSFIRLLKSYIGGQKCKAPKKISWGLHMSYLIPIAVTLCALFNSCKISNSLNYSSLLALIFGFTTTISFFIYQQIASYDEKKYTANAAENFRKIRFVFYASTLASIGSLVLVLLVFFDSIFDIFSISFTFSIHKIHITAYGFSLLFVLILTVTIVILLKALLSMYNFFQLLIEDHQE